MSRKDWAAATQLGVGPADSMDMDYQVGSVRPLKIRGWALGETGSGNYRVGMPMWALAGAGHTTVSIIGADTAVPSDTDVILGQVVADPGRFEIWEQIANLPGRRPVLIAELDDDLWNVHRSNIHGASFREKETLELAERALRMADAVTVTTDHLASMVKPFNEHVYVLPNCIDLNLLLHQREEAQRMTIGWTVSTSHAMDAVEMAGPLGHYLRKHPEVDLHLVGADFRPAVHADNVRWSPWNKELNDYVKGLDFHIGLAPLKFHAFNKARSDIKALEYAALGIPTVASHYGPYPETIVHGETGFLVKQPHEWGKYLNMLVNDPMLRLTMGVNAKLWASNRTIQGNAWRWELAFRETIARVHGEPVSGLLAPQPEPVTV